jgi:hypothetical protein
MSETHQSIPNSFEEFFKNNTDASLNVPSNTPNEEKEETLEQRFEREREEWSDKIQTLSSKLKKVFDINELMVDIYTERQRALEYHGYLLSLLTKANKKYRSQYTKKYDYYSYTSQKRFPNERNKELQIYSELADIIEIKEMIDNHAKFMFETKNTLDNIIYGIKYRIELERIQNGQ